MVLNFSLIPLHLQKQVAEKLEICDFMHFRQSSKHGNSVGDLVKTRISMDMAVLNIHSVDNKEFFYWRRTESGRIYYWDKIQLNENRPHFSTSSIDYTVDNMTNERLAEIISESEQGCFSGKRTVLKFLAPKVPFNMELFTRFLEVFGVVAIHQYHGTGAMNLRYFKLPVVRKLQHVEATHSFIEDDDILALNARTINCLTKSPNIRETLNRFLKQWYYNEREIVLLRLERKKECKQQDWSEADRNETFTDLPVEILWSEETHDSSMFSMLKLKDLRDFTNSEKSFYSLQRGNTTVCITIADTYVSILAMDNPKKNLLFHLEDRSYKKYKKLCKK